MGEPLTPDRSELPATAGLRRACVLATARTGSNFLQRFLDLLPGVRCYPELFSQQGNEEVLRQLRTTPEERDRAPIEWLEAVYDRTARELRSLGLVGFRLFIWHNLDVLRHVCGDARHKVVVLERENKLAQYSSLLIARTSGRWRDVSDDAVPAIEKPAFVPGSFLRFVGWHVLLYAHARELLTASGKDWFELKYTELQDPRRFGDLLDWLGVEAEGGVEGWVKRVPLRRQNAPEIDERFSNPEEVRSALSALGRDDWLRETLAPDALAATKGKTRVER